MLGGAQRTVWARIVLALCLLNFICIACVYLRMYTYATLPGLSVSTVSPWAISLHLCLPPLLPGYHILRQACSQLPTKLSCQLDMLKGHFK